jgi:hypothetical protein
VIRIARLFDGVDGDGKPCFAEDRGRLDDVAVRQQVAAYTNGGTMVLALLRDLPDAVDPSRGDVVPHAFHTDGTWVWSTALGYYAQTHGIAPEAEFLAHMAAHGYRPAEPDEAAVAAAQAALDEAGRR